MNKWCTVQALNGALQLLRLCKKNCAIPRIWSTSSVVAHAEQLGLSSKPALYVNRSSRSHHCNGGDELPFLMPFRKLIGTKGHRGRHINYNKMVKRKDVRNTYILCNWLISSHRLFSMKQMMVKAFDVHLPQQHSLDYFVKFQGRRGRCSATERAEHTTVE